MNLRPADNSDEDAIRDLVFSVLREYGLSPDPEDTDADLADIKECYCDRGGTFDVLENADGVIVGSVGLFRIDAATCELRKMYLLPSCRGKGWGKKLLEHAIEKAREIGCKRMVLETASVLKEAIALYTDYGFRPWNAPHLSSRCDQAYELEL